MIRELKVQPVKTYATHENAVRAVQRAFHESHNLRYFVTTTPEGRFFPVFVGTDALQSGVHFHFNVVA